jgi:hypothetical protein
VVVVCRTGRLSHGEESGFRGVVTCFGWHCVDWQNTSAAACDWPSSHPATAIRHVKVDLFWFAAQAAMCSSTHFSILLPRLGRVCDACATLRLVCTHNVPTRATT